MNRCLFFIFICLLPGMASIAQTTRRDSLKHVLLHTPNRQENYYRLAARLAETYRFQQPDSALKYAQQTLAGPETKSLFRFKASAHNTIGYAKYQIGDYPAAIKSFQQYYTYAARTHDTESMAYAINNQGNVYIDLGQYDQALRRYRQALALRQKIGDRKGIAMSYSNIGYIYKDLGDYEEAVRNMMFGLREMEALGDKTLIASCCNMLGSVLIIKKDYDEAIRFQKRAIALQRETGDKNAQAISLQVLANAYGMQGNYSASLEANQQALLLLQAASDWRQISILESNIGELYARQQDYSASIPHYEQAIMMAQRIGYRRGLSNFWLGQAQNFISLNRLPEARKLLDSASVMIQQTHNKEQLKTIYELEARYHAARGDFKQALAYSFLFSTQKDSLLNEENLKAMSEMNVKYESEKKQSTIAKLDKESALQQLQLREQSLRLAKDKLSLAEADLQLTQSSLKIKTQNARILQQELDATQHALRMDSLSREAKMQSLELNNRKLQVRQRNAAIGGLIVLLLLGGLLGFSYYRRAQLQAAARMQASLMQQQDAATRAVLEAEEAERVRIAKDLHDGVGQLMSAARMNLSAYEHEDIIRSPGQSEALEKALLLVDQSCSELRNVSHNMMPNALLKNNLAAAVRSFISQIDQRRLAVHLHTEGLDERLDANLEAMLYRIIQECVNNVIKHSGANTLDLSLRNDAEGITVSIEDNGCGFSIPVPNSDHEGIGLKNIRTRMDYLRGSMEIDSAPGRGTVIMLQVPVSPGKGVS
ncbi:MAG: tetratricopeptide repeat protein [Bacteroidetes bacterium]|nr:tetratricopeptide repeat protein [Bacteroidota bacterium]